MAPGKKLLVIVPPDGARIRSIRIRVAVVIFLGLIFLAGFGGYFIPLSSTTINAVERYEKNNLEQQNNKLRQITPEAFKLSGLLRKDIKNLEKKIEQLQSASGLKVPSEPTRLTVPFIKALPPNKVIELCAENEAAVRRLSTYLAAKPGLLSSIPVNYPIPTRHVVTAHFGRTNDPFTNMVKRHDGNDFIAEVETPVIATASGTIARIEHDRIWGKRITISHGYGFSTVYAHLGTVSVFTGKKVKKGEAIATVGISGITTGPHLHYEIWHNGKALDPEDYYFPEVDSFFTAMTGIILSDTAG